MWLGGKNLPDVRISPRFFRIFKAPNLSTRSTIRWPSKRFSSARQNQPNFNITSCVTAHLLPYAVVTQLGECKTEDLEVAGSSPAHGTMILIIVCGATIDCVRIV